MRLKFAEIPDHVSHVQLRQICTFLGVDFDCLRSLHIERDYVEFEIIVTTERGTRYAIRDELATVPIRVPVGGGEWERTVIVDRALSQP